MSPLAYLKIGGAVAALAVVGWAYHVIKDSGRQEERAAIAAKVQRKLNDANIANDAHLRCVANPECRLSNDGFRRD